MSVNRRSVERQVAPGGGRAVRGVPDGKRWSATRHEAMLVSSDLLREPFDTMPPLVFRVQVPGDY